MKVYLAGPMKGIAQLNKPAFDACAVVLRVEQHDVFNPADLIDLGARAALGKEMQWITSNAEAIALMPGWEKSKGALAELALAKALGLWVREL